MKKIAVILVLFVLMSSTAFGQFYLDIGYSFGSSSIIDIDSIDLNISGFTPPRSESALTSRPGIGFGVDMGDYDFIGSIVWIVNRISMSYVDNFNDVYKGSITAQGFGLNGGIAWKATVSDRLTLSFPILLRFERVGFTFSIKEPASGKLTYYANTFGIDAGARAHYDVGSGWGIYAGFQLGIMEFMWKPRMRLSAAGSSISESLDMTGFSLFPSGSINLGVTYSF